MNRFPLSIDLKDRPVYLVGQGEQIRQKAEKLMPFGPKLIHASRFTSSDAASGPALVIVGDTPLKEAEEISGLCRRYRIPVNVVDVPRLCSFYFPALITRGNLTVSISTGGTGPAAAAYLRRQLEEALPERTEEILDWISLHRESLRSAGILTRAVAAAFEKNRPLTPGEISRLTAET